MEKRRTSVRSWCGGVSDERPLKCEKKLQELHDLTIQLKKAKMGIGQGSKRCRCAQDAGRSLEMEMGLPSCEQLWMRMLWMESCEVKDESGEEKTEGRKTSEEVRWEVDFESGWLGMNRTSE